MKDLAGNVERFKRRGRARISSLDLIYEIYLVVACCIRQRVKDAGGSAVRKFVTCMK